MASVIKIKSTAATGLNNTTASPANTTLPASLAVGELAYSFNNQVLALGSGLAGTTSTIALTSTTGTATTGNSIGFAVAVGTTWVIGSAISGTGISVGTTVTSAGVSNSSTSVTISTNLTGAWAPGNAVTVTPFATLDATAGRVNRIVGGSAFFDQTAATFGKTGSGNNVLASTPTIVTPTINQINEVMLIQSQIGFSASGGDSAIVIDTRTTTDTTLRKVKIWGMLEVTGCVSLSGTMNMTQVTTFGSVANFNYAEGITFQAAPTSTPVNAAYIIKAGPSVVSLVSTIYIPALTTATPDTFATLAATQTFTNKTLTSPVISTGSTISTALATNVAAITIQPSTSYTTGNLGTLTLNANTTVGGKLTITELATATGSTALAITPAAHTAVTAETPAFSVAANTLTISAGFASQRFNRFTAPIIAASATSLTVATAATVAITGAPSSGTNAPILTASYALLVEAGDVLFKGLIKAGSTPTTLTNSAGNILSSALYGAVAVGQGGTGVTTFTTNGVLYGAGTGAINNAVGTAAQVLTNAAGVPTWGTVDLASSAAVTGILPLANGGTGVSLAATGGANQFVRQSTLGGTFTVSAIAAADLPAVAATGSIGLSIVTGSAQTAMRSDSAPSLSQAIAPTWTAQHIFNVAPQCSVAPAGDSNLANKLYVDTVAQGLHAHPPADVILLSGLSDSTAPNSILTGRTSYSYTGTALTIYSTTNNLAWVVDGLPIFDITLTTVASVIGAGVNSLSLVSFTAASPVSIPAGTPISGGGIAPGTLTTTAFSSAAAITSIGLSKVTTGSTSASTPITVACGWTRIVISGETYTTASATTPNTEWHGIYTKGQIGGTAPNAVSSIVFDRAADANTLPELSGGDFVFIQRGLNFADTGFVQSVSTILTTAWASDNGFSPTFVQFSAAGVILAGTGLTKSGNSLSVSSITHLTAVGTISSGTIDGGTF